MPEWAGPGALSLRASPCMLALGETDAGADPRDSVSVQRLGEFFPGEQSRRGDESFQLYERIDDLPWLRERIERDRTSANYQGSPLWPMQVLAAHPALAAWFGLGGAVADRHCCLPSCESIRQRLARLRDLGMGTCWTFAAYRGDEPLTERAYVRAFLEDRTLPCAAEDSRDFLHDWSYHFLSLLLPDFLEGIRVNVDILLRLAARVRLPTKQRWGVYGCSEDASGRLVTRFVDEALPYEEAIARRIAIGIDVLTARPVQALLESMAGREDKAVEISRPCALYLGPPTQASLQHLLPEVATVLVTGAVGLSVAPQDDGGFVTHAWRRLKALDDALTGIDETVSCAIPPQTMSRLLAYLTELRRSR